MGKASKRKEERIERELAPWDRQPDETSKAYAAFVTFRDIGPSRSLPEAYRKHTGKQTARAGGTWGVWYRKHHWKERAECILMSRMPSDGESTPNVAQPSPTGTR